LVETWIDEMGWEKVKGKLSRGYKWGVKKGEKVNRKGKVKKGMVMGVRKDMMDGRIKVDTEREGIMKGKVRVGEEVWEIREVYVSRMLGKILNELEEWVENGKAGVIKIMVGDFNARTVRTKDGLI